MSRATRTKDRPTVTAPTQGADKDAAGSRHAKGKAKSKVKSKGRDKSKVKGRSGRGRSSKARPRTSATLSVNLLSAWSFEAMAARRLRRRFAAAGVVLLLLLAAGWAVQHVRISQAEQVLAIEQGEQGSLSAQVAELAPVRSFVTAVDKRRTTVSEAMAYEIAFSELLTELSLSTPADAELTSVAVTLAPPPPPAAPAPADPAADPAAGEAAAGAPAGEAVASTPVTASPCPGPDPFGTKTVVGCVTLSGTAASREAVGQLVIDLDRSRLFVEPFISTTTTADGAPVTFSGTVGLSPRALTGRYADLDALLSAQEQ